VARTREAPRRGLVVEGRDRRTFENELEIGRLCPRANPQGRVRRIPHLGRASRSWYPPMGSASMNRRSLIRMTVASPLSAHSLPRWLGPPERRGRRPSFLGAMSSWRRSRGSWRWPISRGGLEIDVVNEGRRPWLYYAGGLSAATNSPINADSIRVAESLGRGHLFWDRMLSPGPRILYGCRCRA
jgi:hypothetical protein